MTVQPKSLLGWDPRPRFGEITTSPTTCSAAAWSAANCCLKSSEGHRAMVSAACRNDFVCEPRLSPASQRTVSCFCERDAREERPAFASGIPEQDWAAGRRVEAIQWADIPDKTRRGEAHC
jgi:hypothetical protein